jgi:azobenzene reductase
VTAASVPTVLVLPGSVLPGSHTRALANAISNQIAIMSATVRVFDGAHLPLADPRYHANPLHHPDIRVREFAEIADASDAFVLLSPIYHNAYSGYLKNLLDHLSIAQFRNKVIGLAGHGGNRNSQAVDQLRIVARGLNAIPTPSQVCTADSDYRRESGEFVVSSDDISNRIVRLAGEVITMTTALKPVRETML